MIVPIVWYFWNSSDSVVFWNSSDSVVFWNSSEGVVFWNSSEGVVFSVFHFISTLTKKKER